MRTLNEVLQELLEVFDRADAAALKAKSKSPSSLPKRALMEWLKEGDNFEWAREIQDSAAQKNHSDEVLDKKLKLLTRKKREIFQGAIATTLSEAAQSWASLDHDSGLQLLKKYKDYIPEFFEQVMMFQTPKNSPNIPKLSPEKTEPKLGYWGSYWYGETKPINLSVSEKFKDSSVLAKNLINQAFLVYEIQKEPKRSKKILELLRQYNGFSSPSPSTVSSTTFSDPLVLDLESRSLLSKESCIIWLNSLLKNPDSQTVDKIIQMLLRTAKSELELEFLLEAIAEEKCFHAFSSAFMEKRDQQSEYSHYTLKDIKELNKIFQKFREIRPAEEFLVYFLTDWLLLKIHQASSEEVDLLPGEASKSEFNELLEMLQDQMFPVIESNKELREIVGKRTKQDFIEIEQEIERISMGQGTLLYELQNRTSDSFYLITSEGEVIKESSKKYVYRNTHETYSATLRLLKTLASDNLESFGAEQALANLKDLIVDVDEFPDKNIMDLLKKHDNFQLLMQLYEEYTYSYSEEALQIKESIHAIVKRFFEASPNVMLLFSQENRWAEWCFLVRILEIENDLAGNNQMFPDGFDVFIEENESSENSWRNLQSNYHETLKSATLRQKKRTSVDAFFEWITKGLLKFLGQGFIKNYGLVPTVDTELTWSFEKIKRALQKSTGKPMVVGDFFDRLSEGKQLCVLKEGNGNKAKELKEALNITLKKLTMRPSGLYHYFFTPSPMEALNQAVSSGDAEAFTKSMARCQTELAILMQQTYFLCVEGVEDPTEINQVSAIFATINQHIKVLSTVSDKKAADMKQELEQFKNTTKVKRGIVDLLIKEEPHKTEQILPMVEDLFDHYYAQLKQYPSFNVLESFIQMANYWRKFPSEEVSAKVNAAIADLISHYKQEKFDVLPFPTFDHPKALKALESLKIDIAPAAPKIETQEIPRPQVQKLPSCNQVIPTKNARPLSYLFQPTPPRKDQNMLDPYFKPEEVQKSIAKSF